MFSDHSILKIIYDALYWGQNTLVGGKKQPLLIVLDEAHAYLKAGEESISSRTVQAIAKEGRKYGVGLLLVTQRPSELDETVLSQCGTMIALRMTNTRDKGHVSSAMQDELREMTEVLSSLRTGEAIAIHLPKEATVPIPENMEPVASTNITAVGYDAENLTVYIQFLDGSAYAYKGVQEHEFENLKTAP